MEAVERDPREEVAQIFTSAGWTAGKGEGWDGQFIYRNTSIVGGIAPNGASVVKNVERIPPGHPQHSEDTPDTLVEAAQWLVARYANPLTTEATLDPAALQSEEVETPQHESDGETGEEQSDEDAAALGAGGDELGADGDVHLRHPAGMGELDEGSAEGVDAPGDANADSQRAEPDLIDADFEAIDQLGSEDDLLTDEQLILEGGDPWAAPELPAPPVQDFAPDELTEPGAGAFIFGDNLDQLRTAAIGRVIRHANTLMPPWSPDDHARLVTLRNFAMGVSEGRWDDDAAQSTELNALETALRRINEIKAARDAKVEFLEAATRPQIEGFTIEADWP